MVVLEMKLQDLQEEVAVDRKLHHKMQRYKNEIAIRFAKHKEQAPGRPRAYDCFAMSLYQLMYQ